MKRFVAISGISTDDCGKTYFVSCNNVYNEQANRQTDIYIEIEHHSQKNHIT